MDYDNFVITKISHDKFFFFQKYITKKIEKVNLYYGSIWCPIIKINILRKII